jgi:hypothetical protein
MILAQVSGKVWNDSLSVPLNVSLCIVKSRDKTQNMSECELIIGYDTRRRQTNRTATGIAARKL